MEDHVSALNGVLSGNTSSSGKTLTCLEARWACCAY